MWRGVSGWIWTHHQDARPNQAFADTGRGAGDFQEDKNPTRIMKLVLIEWIDSHHQTGWVCEVPEAKVMHCRSVGWVVAENEEALVLAASLAEGQHCGEMTIPKCSIREIKDL
jgi:hypothetical protein